MGIKKANHKKARGVVYTPEWLVDLVLDQVPGHLWFADGLVADFSCGDGVFLERISERVLRAHLEAGCSKEQAAQWCADHIWGSDIDPKALRAARARLNAWALSRGLPVHRWNLRKFDLLSPGLFKALSGKCAVVVGNPPYVRVQNLDGPARAAAQKMSFCAEGSTDLYLACYELGLDFLKPEGCLSFVSPNSWLRAKAGRAMREALSKHGLARTVIDFGDFTPFEGIGAYCAVVSLGKQREETFDFFEWDKKKSAKVSFKTISCGAWLDTPPIHGTTVASLSAKVAGRRAQATLGELCRLGVGFATLADSVFIADEGPMVMDASKKLCAFHKDGTTHWLETTMVVPLVKASTSKPPKAKPTRWIVHPYQAGKSGRPELIGETQLEKIAPRVHAYLLANKKMLLSRDKGKVDPAAWHGYGRSQGLLFSFEAWAASPSLSKKPEFFEMPQRWRALPVAFVSGLGVGFDAPRWARVKMMATLNSERMSEHMRWAAADYAGGYKSYNKNAVQTLKIDPFEAGVLWFEDAISFLAWAASSEAKEFSPKAHAAALNGSCSSARVWALAKATMRDALRCDEDMNGKAVSRQEPLKARKV